MGFVFKNLCSNESDKMDICPNENLFSVSVTNTLANQTVCWQPSQEARCLGGVLLLLPGARLSPEATMEWRGEGRASIPSKWPSCKISPVISVQRWMSPARPPHRRHCGLVLVRKHSGCPPTPQWAWAARCLLWFCTWNASRCGVSCASVAPFQDRVCTRVCS